MPRLMRGMPAAKRCRSSILGLSQTGFAWEGVQVLPCLPTEFCGRDASRKVWTGWIDAPAPFFCGTVVPAIAASNPHIHFRQSLNQNQWRCGFKIFSTQVLVLG